MKREVDMKVDFGNIEMDNIYSADYICGALLSKQSDGSYLLKLRNFIKSRDGSLESTKFADKNITLERLA